MRPDDKPQRIITHRDPEENLSAAKATLRRNRHTYMLRRTWIAGDVIDIIEDGIIIERHIVQGLSSFLGGPRYRIDVEEMALYR